MSNQLVRVQYKFFHRDILEKSNFLAMFLSVSKSMFLGNDRIKYVTKMINYCLNSFS